MYLALVLFQILNAVYTLYDWGIKEGKNSIQTARHINWISSLEDRLWPTRFWGILMIGGSILYMFSYIRMAGVLWPLVGYLLAAVNILGVQTGIRLLETVSYPDSYPWWWRPLNVTTAVIAIIYLVSGLMVMYRR